MLWNDYRQAIAERMREPDMAVLSMRLMTGVPYLTKDDLDDVLYSSLLQVLREVDQSDWESFSSLAVRTLTGTSPLAIPRNIVRPIAYSVDNNPTIYTSIGTYHQWGDVSGANTYTNRFTFMGGECLFKGSSISLTILVEPTMDDWRNANDPVLPPGLDVRVIDLAAKRIVISDYVPEWRP